MMRGDLIIIQFRMTPEEIFTYARPIAPSVTQGGNCLIIHVGQDFGFVFRLGVIWGIFSSCGSFLLWGLVVTNPMGLRITD